MNRMAICNPLPISQWAILFPQSVELTPVWLVWLAGAEDEFSEERWDEREPIKIGLETTQASTDECWATTLTNSLTENQQLFILIHINNISQHDSQHDALSGD